MAVVLVLLGLFGAAGVVAFGNWRSRNLNANESAAIATLKNISSAQAQCQASGVIDVDGNGQGEYGFFGELSGHVPVRGADRLISPPVLSAGFADVVAARVERSGYVFQMFLPDARDQGVAEDPSGGDVDDDNGVGVQQAEELWCCYAWPRDQGWSGKRVFFVNQGGDVLTTNCFRATYEGVDRPCPFDAAFAGSAERSMRAPVAANTIGRDGNTWVVI